MQTSLLLTVTGADKPGLVDALSSAIANADANWEESRMAHLAGHFAGIVHVTVPNSSRDDLMAALRDLEAQGLHVSVQEGSPAENEAKGEALKLQVMGNDRAGIVREVSRVLSTHGVNVEDLYSETLPAPHAGHMMFRAVVRMSCPASVSVDTLRDALEALAGDLMVDIESSTED